MTKEEDINENVIAKKTENETANNIVDLNMFRKKDKTLVDVRLVFKKGTSLKKIIGDTQKVIDTFAEKKEEDNEGFTWER